MAIMKEVANRAGVSTATVSNVINKTRFVSNEVKSRVVKAIKELDYRPNAIARSLSIKRTYTIAAIVSNILNLPLNMRPIALLPIGDPSIDPVMPPRRPLETVTKYETWEEA